MAVLTDLPQSKPLELIYFVLCKYSIVEYA